ncbi:uncharacterized protein [Malus domestica]|uniref:uncharacterized protein n=1 Tax=Malus domestica TaxID=3750 RepID=UPI0004988951
MESHAPINKVQLQRLLEKIRFIAKLLCKIQSLTPSLRLKNQDKFKWSQEHQEAFDKVKIYLASPPVLMPPQMEALEALHLASEKSIGSLLAHNNEGRNEQAVYYLSRILTDVETKYTPTEKLCLALYFTAYMLPCHIHIIAKTNVCKYMLSKPMLTGMIGKWILGLSEFSFQ